MKVQNRTDTSYINFKYSPGKETLSAILSPDAAYYMGVMSLTKDEQGYYDQSHEANDAAMALAKAGVAPNPVPRDCYFVLC